MFEFLQNQARQSGSQDLILVNSRDEVVRVEAIPLRACFYKPKAVRFRDSTSHEYALNTRIASAAVSRSGGLNRNDGYSGAVSSHAAAIKSWIDLISLELGGRRVTAPFLFA